MAPLDRHLLPQGIKVLFGFILTVFLVVNLSISQFSDSLHDLYGGRLPFSDSAGWVKGAIGASQGLKQSWVSRRPLNVLFNVPIYHTASLLKGDPLVNALRIKRILAAFSIALLVFSLSAIVGLVPRFMAALLLLSVLFSGTGSRLSMIFGNAVGYTHGTELNGFIFITAGVACLIPFVARIYSSRSIRGRDLLLACSGLLLACLATLMRPGPVLLVPLIVAIIIPGLFGVGSGSKINFSIHKLIAGIAAVFLVLVAAAGMQQIAFSLISDECGAIGGNQGYTVYGLSQGGNWTLGRDYILNKGLSRCERVINPMLIKKGREEMIANPAPFVRRILMNAKERLRFWLKNKYQVALACTLLAPIAFPAFRIRIFEVLRSQRRLLGVLALSLAGCLASDIFIFVFLGEAGVRPIIPYAVFPVLFFTGLSDLYIKALPLLGRFPFSFQDASSLVQSKRLGSGRCEYLLILPFTLFLVVVSGVAFLWWQPSFLKFVDNSKVHGFMSLASQPPGILSREDWRIERLGEFYAVKVDDGLPSENLGWCLSYARDRVPFAGPLGNVRVTKSNCGKR